ncbi:DUF1702 family protein [Streptomyces ficellus]|uniref:DUF1702 family protein n=1 Tax=Streptomyces ficellus TaxID=1977088 RepID=A0ABT7Z8Z0_9ACTN|nr:DUF1702 family protein [Streptomyces ficellus]MDN3295967.1 DUF1702 family protein [Streptomyces ficellus]
MRRVVIPLLRQDTAQVDFGVRRFRLRPGPARGILQAAAQAFLCGFHAALRARALPELAAEVERLPAERRGFAYEGAGMACGLLDLLTASRGRRFAALLAGPAARYPHLAQVGAGWAYARLGLRPRDGIPGASPPECWLAWDGYGFHQGFFHPDRVIGRQYVERGLNPDERAIRDQGLGRALWFHECADPDGIALRIAEFPAGRRADLWSGAGLAATYAGGATPHELRHLAALAGEHRPDLAQGAAFACKAHHIAGAVPAHTAEAAPVLTGTGVEQAADWTDRSLAALGPAATGTGHYQRWRAGIRAQYAALGHRGDR